MVVVQCQSRRLGLSSFHLAHIITLKDARYNVAGIVHVHSTVPVYTSEGSLPI